MHVRVNYVWPKIIVPYRHSNLWLTPDIWPIWARAWGSGSLAMALFWKWAVRARARAAVMWGRWVIPWSQREPEKSETAKKYGNRTRELYVCIICSWVVVCKGLVWLLSRSGRAAGWFCANPHLSQVSYHDHTLHSNTNSSVATINKSYFT